jgi:mRNA interferase MazF
VQSNDFNNSAIATVIVAVITSNLRLAAAPGNIRLSRRQSKLKRASVVNVSQLFTIDKSLLTGQVSAGSAELIHQLDIGLKLVLGL